MNSRTRTRSRWAERWAVSRVEFRVLFLDFSSWAIISSSRSETSSIPNSSLRDLDSVSISSLRTVLREAV